MIRQLRDGRLLITSPKPIQFPRICINCGKPTRHTYHLAPSKNDTRVSRQNSAGILVSLLVPGLGILMNAQDSSLRLRIPICIRCQILDLVPGKVGAIITVLFLLNMLLLFYHLIQASGMTTILHMALFPVFLILMICLWRFRKKPMIPIDFYYDAAQYHYIIQGGSLLEYYKNQQSELSE
ncbi:MAG: hypothetical protein AAF571_00365 [Verrucomicrobiota bacterium]